MAAKPQAKSAYCMAASPKAAYCMAAKPQARSAYCMAASPKAAYCMAATPNVTTRPSLELAA
jgi:hypothetical protein